MGDEVGKLPWSKNTLKKEPSPATIDMSPHDVENPNSTD